MISEKDIKYIASLARLDLSDEEIKKMTTDMSSVLDYVEELNSVDTSKTSPTLSAVSFSNNFRQDDEKTIKCDQKCRQDLIELAPESEDGFIKVKAILK